MTRLLLLSCLLALDAHAAAKNPGVLVYATALEPDGFDPAWAQNMSPLFNVYETLVAFPGTGVRAEDLAPRLATKVPTRANGLLSADGLVYRFPIRKGVRFHDGSTLAPEDVRYSLLRFMLLDRAGGPSSSLLEPVLGVSSTRRDGAPIDGLYERAAAAITVEGDDVVVRLRRPFAPFLGVLANLGRVVSRSWCAANGQWDGRPETWKRHNNATRGEALDSRANGTGPFRLARIDPATRDIVLERHDGYWRGPAALERVFIKQVPELMTRRLMLQAGDADVIHVNPMDVPPFKGLPGVEVIDGLQKLQVSKALRFVLSVDPSGNPNIGSGRLDGEGVPPDFFADKDVRKAFAYAIDYDGYIRDVYQGRAARLHGFIPPGLIGHRDASGPYRFDLARAAAHLRKAWGGRVQEKGFKVSLLYLAESDDRALCMMLARNLAAIDPRFRVEPRALPYASYTGLVGRRMVPVRVSASTAGYPDPNDLIDFLRSGGDSGYSHPRADALLDRAAAEGDPRKRAALYAELQAIADEDAPRVPIANVLHARVQRAWVKGFVFNPAAHNLPYDSDYYVLRKEETGP